MVGYHFIKLGGETLINLANIESIRHMDGRTTINFINSKNSLVWSPDPNRLIYDRLQNYLLEFDHQNLNEHP